MAQKSVTPASVRLIPAVMAAMAATLGLKAVAMAEGAGDVMPHGQENAEQHGEQQAGGEPGEGAAPSCPNPSFAEMAGLSQSEVQVLQALGARREALEQREASIDTQGELMTAAERRLDERIAELRRLEEEVGVLLGHLDEAQETRIAGLVDVYQRMRAKDAAAVFDGLDDTVMVQVASRMRQANLAEIMGKMNPARARELTQMLAELSRPPANAQALLDRASASSSGAASAAR